MQDEKQDENTQKAFVFKKNTLLDKTALYLPKNRFSGYLIPLRIKNKGIEILFVEFMGSGGTFYGFPGTRSEVDSDSKIPGLVVSNAFEQVGVRFENELTQISMEEDAEKSTADAPRWNCFFAHWESNGSLRAPQVQPNNSEVIGASWGTILYVANLRLKKKGMCALKALNKYLKERYVHDDNFRKKITRLDITLLDLKNVLLSK